MIRKACVYLSSPFVFQREEGSRNAREMCVREIERTGGKVGGGGMCLNLTDCTTFCCASISIWGSLESEQKDKGRAEEDRVEG